LCQSLQFRSRNLFTGEHYFNEYGQIVAPVNADMLINPLHQGIAPILHLQAIDAVRNFFGHPDGQFADRVKPFGTEAPQAGGCY